jgi:2-polyprenyl-3-methyl-5-hydroxy-6-metoxy-1,4-benzoquinol methylase
MRLAAPVTPHLKRALLGAISGLTGRTAVLLPAQAGDGGEILDVRAPYRVDGPTLTVAIDERAQGQLTAAYYPFRADATWTSEALAYDGPGLLTLDLANGSVRFCDRTLGSVTGGGPVRDRRFAWGLTLDTAASRLHRRTGHYVARVNAPVDAAYFRGEDYTDYEAESEAVHRDVIALARAHRADGPALEVGCATGGTLEALAETGFEAYGLDFSPWAVEQARRRVGEDRVWLADVESAPFPAALTAHAPFRLLVLASVFEHFRRPFDVLARLTAVTAPGATLILITSNADSLTHRIFGADWEGYFDWTHHGVAAVTAASVREGLARLGWHVRELRTWNVWDGSDDPTHATMRDWLAADARFARLLAERDLGDFITCVAVRA